MRTKLKRKGKRISGSAVARFLWFALLEFGLVSAVWSLTEISLGFRVVMTVIITVIVALFFAQKPSDEEPPDITKGLAP